MSSKLLSNLSTELVHLQNKINRQIGQAIADFSMIQDGDKILIAVSGGKDSLLMLHFLQAFQKKAPIAFDFIAVHLDQAQPGYPKEVMPKLFEDWNTPYLIERRDTYSVVKEKLSPEQTMCSLCSRLRRGILYSIARENECNKIALGHHRDDILETFLMNAFYSGKLGTMPAHYIIEKEDLAVIRPLAYVEEKDIKTYVDKQGWPIVPCRLCGSQEGLKRQSMKKLLTELQKESPDIKNTLFGSLKNPAPEMLYKPNLWKGQWPKM